MKITQRCVVRMHYELTDESGQMMVSTRNGEPAAILVGSRNVVYGLELALEGHLAGDVFDVTVPPEEGYGLRREGWIERFSKKHFSRPKALRIGQQSGVRTPQGMRWVTIFKVGSKMVDVDMNHPMAGQPLHYSVEILDVREAEREEVAHGHAHSTGGHEH